MNISQPDLYADTPTIDCPTAQNETSCSNYNHGSSSGNISINFCTWSNSTNKCSCNRQFGLVANSNNKCVCKANYGYARGSISGCTPCPAGTYSKPDAATLPTTCKPCTGTGRIVTPNGCECNITAGYTYSGTDSGECVCAGGPCQAAAFTIKCPSAANETACNSYNHGSSTGGIPISFCTWNNNTQKCSCNTDYGLVANANGQCVCKEGFGYQKGNLQGCTSCADKEYQIPNLNTLPAACKSCTAEGRIIDPVNGCVCDTARGYEYDGDKNEPCKCGGGACAKANLAISCPAATTEDACGKYNHGSIGNNVAFCTWNNSTKTCSCNAEYGLVSNSNKQCVCKEGYGYEPGSVKGCTKCEAGKYQVPDLSVLPAACKTCNGRGRIITGSGCECDVSAGYRYGGNDSNSDCACVGGACRAAALAIACPAAPNKELCAQYSHGPSAGSASIAFCTWSGSTDLDGTCSCNAAFNLVANTQAQCVCKQNYGYSRGNPNGCTPCGEKSYSIPDQNSLPAACKPCDGYGRIVTDKGCECDTSLGFVADGFDKNDNCACQGGSCGPAQMKSGGQSTTGLIVGLVLALIVMHAFIIATVVMALKNRKRNKLLAANALKDGATPV